MTLPSNIPEIEVAGATDVGKRRAANEDAYCLDDDLQLYMVADGMGGHKAGEVASQMTLDTICQFMRHTPGEEDEEPESSPDQTLSEAANRLLNGIRIANRGVYEVSRQKSAYEGMGTTLSAVLFTQDTVVAANVGDSPIYLIHQDKIQQISVPHTVLAEHAALYPNGENQLDETYGHMLTRAMGVENGVRPDISELPFFEGDTLIIGSDGLSLKVSPEEILETALSNHSAKTCQKLIDMANDRGGEDNITVVVAKVRGSRKRTGPIRSMWRSITKRLFSTTDNRS